MLRRILPYVLGGVIVVACFGAGGLAIVEFGLFDVRASTPHSPLMAWATHTTMIHSVQRQAAGTEAEAPTPDAVRAGFRLYDTDCVGCHGAPGVGREPWANGMTPSPPFLLDAPRHWSPGQLQFIVANGVKMTAMPAWNAVHSPSQIRSIVAFLEALPYLTAGDYARLRAAGPARAPNPATSPAPSRGGQRVGDLSR